MNLKMIKKEVQIILADVEIRAEFLVVVDCSSTHIINRYLLTCNINIPCKKIGFQFSTLLTSKNPLSSADRNDVHGEGRSENKIWICSLHLYTELLLYINVI